MMKTMRLRTYWSASEAHTVFEFLDELKELIWENYGDEITEMLRDAFYEQQANKNQPRLPFDDEEPF